MKRGKFMNLNHLNLSQAATNSAIWDVGNLVNNKMKDVINVMK